MNIVVHSMAEKLLPSTALLRVVITSKDYGPGIDDVDKAMVEGYSTAIEWIRSLGFGAGMGLPNVKAVSDEFNIKSSPKGTEVTSVIKFNNESDEKEQAND